MSSMKIKQGLSNCRVKQYDLKCALQNATCIRIEWNEYPWQQAKARFLDFNVVRIAAKYSLQVNKY
jgi:hypothetical protein